ncbi:GNAT family N-acetyltransferase [Microbacterium sp. NPDC058345]|uniref:GNAT family N-acetyltransferase n=1 Tax=Microbacterium sp. NPDC058345 TaxID=3346455 RepID=UPI003653633D
MPSFPDATLKTPTGLTLSALTVSDAPALVNAFADAELRRWLPLPSPYTMDLAESWCTTTSRELRESGRGFVLGVRDRDALVASIDAKRVDWRARTLELSYWTATAHRGRGVMSTAVRRVADWVISELGFERVELRIATENVGSLRTAARAGFVPEGVARSAGFTDAGRVDLAVFSLIHSDRPTSS